MAKEKDRPKDNYERNFRLVKKFGSNAIFMVIPLLMFMNICCMGYVSIAKKEPLEFTLLRLLMSQVEPNVETNVIESSVTVIAAVFSAFFLFAFLSFHFASRDSSHDAVPDKGLNALYAWSMVQLVFFSLCLAAMVIFMFSFTIRKPEYFERFGSLLNMDADELRAAKFKIILIMLVVCTIFGVIVWFSQSQAECVKSVKLTLRNSIARNKGAHTFGVFSMSVSLALLCLAGLMTFVYYCYSDALTGFRIPLEKPYVIASLTGAYIRGFIPFFVSIGALTFSEMVDEANSVGLPGAIENDPAYMVYDPNMNRNIFK